MLLKAEKQNQRKSEDCFNKNGVRNFQRLHIIWILVTKKTWYEVVIFCVENRKWITLVTNKLASFFLPFHGCNFFALALIVENPISCCSKDKLFKLSKKTFLTCIVHTFFENRSTLLNCAYIWRSISDNPKKDRKINSCPPTELIKI